MFAPFSKVFSYRNSFGHFLQIMIKLHPEWFSVLYSWFYWGLTMVQQTNQENGCRRGHNKGPCRDLQRRKRRRSEHEKGSTLVECSIIFPVFFLFLLAGMDLIRVGFVISSLQWATDRGARYASLGLIGNHCGPSHNQPCQCREESVRQYIETTANLSITPTNFSICQTQPQQSKCTSQYVPGCNSNQPPISPDSWLQISVTRPITLFFGNIQIPLTSSSLIKSEPYFK